jgi:hypothetical protein
VYSTGKLAGHSGTADRRWSAPGACLGDGAGPPTVARTQNDRSWAAGDFLPPNATSYAVDDPELDHPLAVEVDRQSSEQRLELSL